MTVSSPNPSERTSLPHLRLICLAVLLALSGGPFWPLSGPNPSKRASPALLLLSERTTSLKTGSSPAVLCFCVSFLSLSIHPSIHLSIYLSILSYLILSYLVLSYLILLPIYLPIYLSSYLSIYLTIYLSTYLSIYLTIYLSIFHFLYARDF